MRRVLWGGILLASVACGSDGGREASRSSSAFCADVLPKVDSFMAVARATHPTPADERYGGTLVVGSIGDIAQGMNALVSAEYASTQHQYFVNLMTLLNYDENLDPQPYLAESWEVSDDQTAITFHVRRDVYWHDGEPTTARDVAFTYLRVTDPRTAFPNPSFWDHYVRGEEGVEVLDDYTVRIHLEPHAEFLDPWRALAIMPEHLMGDVPPEELAQHPYARECPVGNGPFVFDEHRPQDRWIFTANPAFPEGLGGRPFVDQYVYRVIPEQTTLLTELLTGDIDVYVAVRPDQAGQIEGRPDLALMNFPVRQYTFVAWNTRRPQLSDARVRRAFTMAIDRDEVVDVLLEGYGTVTHSSVAPFHWAFDPDFEGLPYDPEQARALLDDAGWTDRDGDGVRENAEGVPLSFTIKYNRGNQTRQDIAELMQARLHDIGVDAQPKLVEWATLLEQVQDSESRDFDGMVFALAPEFRLDDTDLFHSERIDQPLAFVGLNDPDMDRILEELSSTIDRDEARKVWREYQELLARLQPYTYFYFQNRIEGVNRRLHNVRMDARGEWINIKDWWIDPTARR